MVPLVRESVRGVGSDGGCAGKRKRKRRGKGKIFIHLARFGSVGSVGSAIFPPMPVCLLVCLYVCMFVCLFVCLFVCFFVCLFVCLLVL